MKFLFLFAIRITTKEALICYCWPQQVFSEVVKSAAKNASVRFRFGLNFVFLWLIYTEDWVKQLKEIVFTHFDIFFYLIQSAPTTKKSWKKTDFFFEILFIVFSRILRPWSEHPLLLAQLHLFYLKRSIFFFKLLTRSSYVYLGHLQWTVWSSSRPNTRSTAGIRRYVQMLAKFWINAVRTG